MILFLLPHDFLAIPCSWVSLWDEDHDGELIESFGSIL